MINIIIAEWSEEDIGRAAQVLGGCAGERAVGAKAISMLSGALACVAAGSREPLCHRENGAPFFADASLNVSISHSRALTAVSLGEDEHGIDIEYFRGNTERLYRRVLTASEKLYLGSSNNAEERERLFIRLWTRKEALIKCGAASLGTMGDIDAAADKIYLRGTVYLLATYMYDSYALSVCRKGGGLDAAVRTASDTERHNAVDFVLTHSQV